MKGRWVLPAVLLLAAVSAAASPLPAVIEAYLHQREGDAEAALRSLERALDEDPASAFLRAEIARTLARERRYDDALAVVDEGLGRRPGNPDLLLLRARLLQVTGRGDEAARAAAEAARAGAGDQAYDLAVRIHEARGDLDEAADLAAEWAEAAGSADAWFARGRILARQDRKEEARAALRRALDRDPNHRAAMRALAVLEAEAGNAQQAEALYRRVIEANPHDVEARFRLGQVLLKQGRVDEALEVFEAAERWSGGDPSLRFRLGILLLQEDRPAEAETVFRTMAQARGGDPRTWYLLGVSLLAQEKYAEALEAFGKVPEDADEYPEALVRRAIALDSLDRSDEARQLLEGWIADHPGDEEVVLALAGFWEDRGEFRRAADVIEAYLAAHETGNHRVYFTLGALYDKLGDRPKSVEWMKRSLELNPDDPYTLNYLGYTYAEEGIRLEEAERLIRKALELKPGDGFITDSLGWVYYRQGRYGEAADTLRKALEAQPGDPIIWDHLGDALRKLGRDDEARDAYRRSLELAPDSEAVRRKLEELE